MWTGINAKASTQRHSRHSPFTEISDPVEASIRLIGLIAVALTLWRTGHGAPGPANTTGQSAPPLTTLTSISRNASNTKQSFAELPADADASTRLPRSCSKKL